MKRSLMAAIGFCSLVNAWPAVATDYTPLDCTKARTAAEITICKTYALGQAEARMATLYSVATWRWASAATSKTCRLNFSKPAAPADATSAA